MNAVMLDTRGTRITGISDGVVLGDIVKVTKVMSRRVEY